MYTKPANKSPFRFYRAENDLRRSPPKRTAYRSWRANFKAAEEIVEPRIVRPEPPEAQRSGFTYGDQERTSHHDQRSAERQRRREYDQADKNDADSQQRHDKPDHDSRYAARPARHAAIS